MADDGSQWNVELSKDATKTLRRLDAITRSRILDTLVRLGNDSSAVDFKPLSGRPEWRLRVGKWRLLLEVDTLLHRIVVLEIGSRGDIYKG